MSIATLQQTISVDGVEDVIVTDAEVDTITGDYVREIRVVGADDVIVLTLRIAADERTKIAVSAPVQDF